MFYKVKKVGLHNICLKGVLCNLRRLVELIDVYLVFAKQKDRKWGIRCEVL